MDDDDDDFEYDQDFGSSGDEEFNQDFNLELEMDDLRLELSARRAEKWDVAKSRLVEIAKDHSRKFCLEAAIEVMQLSVDLASFYLLIEAVIAAPEEVSNLTRASALERGWTIIQNQLIIEEPVKTDAFKQSVESMKASGNVNLVLRSLALLASYYIQRERLADAEKTLEDFSTIINSTESHILLDGLRSDYLVLQLEKLMLSPTLDLIIAGSVTSQLDRTANGNLLPKELAIVEEAKARICLQRECTADARSLLKRCVRRYEDLCDLPQHSTSCVRSIVWLILVSAICGQGNYDFSVDTPTLAPLRTDKAVDLAVTVSQTLQNRDYGKYCEKLRTLAEWIKKSPWKLANDSLLYQLDHQIEYRLLTDILFGYSYLKWDTIKARLPKSAQFLATEERLTQFVRIHNSQSNSLKFLLNLTEQAIELTHQPHTPGGHSDYSQIMQLLPRRYAENDAHCQQVSTETQILNQWQTHKTAGGINKSTTNNSAEYRYWAAAQTDAEVTQAMIEALRQHQYAVQS